MSLLLGRGGAVEIVSVLREHRFRWSSEMDLHDGIEQVLVARGYKPQREAPLGSPRDRIDFIVPVHRDMLSRTPTTIRVGVETKVDGTLAEVVRQLHRYAVSGKLDALLLVTTRAKHAPMPDHLGGRPVEVLVLGGCR